MFRDDKALYSTKNVHFVMNHAALGDMLTSLPAVAYARQTTAHEVLMNVWVMEHQVPLVAHLLSGLHNLKARPMHEFDLKKPPSGETDARWLQPGNGFSNGCVSGQLTRNRIPLVDYAHMLLLDRLPRNDVERNYPHTAPLIGPRPLEQDYVVISVGATSDNKIIPEHVIDAVIRWCAEKNYKPVILGKSETLVKAIGENVPLTIRYRYDGLPDDIKALALDMRDKLDLLQARDWCGHARAVVGVDGGLLHLAGTTNTAIVYGYTTIRPEDRGIVRFSTMNWNVEHVGPRKLACTGCQGNWTLMTDHDFRFCAYKDNLCVEKLHGEDFINGLISLGL